MAEMTSRERLMTALSRGVPDRIPCFPNNIRWLRHHYRCTCPRHQLKLAEDFGFDPILNFGQYVWQSISNDYTYAPGGGYAYAATGLYGDLPDVSVELQIENQKDRVFYRRTFETPAGSLHDAIEWPRSDMGYGDGPNPHRVEPLVKTESDLDALAHLIPAPRTDLLADIPLLLADIGSRALVAASDNTHLGSWGLEVLGVEERLICSIAEPALFHRICRMTNDVHLRNLRAMLDRGIRVVFDSWFQAGPSNGWSPQTFQDVFLPLVRECINLAHEYEALYIYQDDGRMRDVIPFVVDAGADVISGLQPPPLGDVVLKNAKAQYGQRAALMGGLDPCYVFDLGSPDKVRQAIREAIQDAGAGGGYVLGTAEAAAPETTIECWRAAVQAVRDFGTYCA